MGLKRKIQDVTPPLIWRNATRLKRTLIGAGGKGSGPSPGSEQPRAFYDQTFDDAAHWKAHYTASRYYPLWTVVADRLRGAGVKRVLDIGCGPGQVACLLRDTGVSDYLGLDFSTARIAWARQVCPEFEFVSDDVFQTDLLTSRDYQCIVLMEFLEHVDRDLELLERVPRDRMILGTVPNFPSESHVRHFDCADQVHDRYSPLMSECRVTEVLASRAGQTYYLIQGRR